MGRGLALLMSAAVWVDAGAAAPDFSAIVEVEPEVVEAGKVIGLIRNIGAWTIRNVVLRVRHQWSWADGGSYRHSENAIVSELVYPGDPAGFAAVHIPPRRVPASAAYRMDVTVLELTEIRIAAEP